MVPMGMERWASLRSPERLEPAMIPEENKNKTKKKNHQEFLDVAQIHCKNVSSAK